MTDHPAPRIVRNDDAGRFEIYEGDVLAGFTTFRRAGDVVDFAHTEVFPEFGGRGLAGELVGEAMRQMRDEGQTVLPTCPYVENYLVKHPVDGLSVQPLS